MASIYKPFSLSLSSPAAGFTYCCDSQLTVLALVMADV